MIKKKSTSLLVPVLIVQFLIGIVAMEVKSENAKATLKVAFPYAKSATEYEPARIHLGPEYIFLENVFSPLVEMNSRGEIVSGVADSFYWKENDLHLVIRDNLKTVDGLSITAKDAEFSLKRLLLIPENTHGDFRELICGATKFRSLSDSCSGISVVGNELVLKTTAAGKTFLLPMLITADFSIIPKSSVDLKTLKIIDYRNTSGPFFVAKDDAKGRIVLNANPNHYHYSKDIPQTIELVPSDLTDKESSFKDFKAGRVDLITTIDLARADAVINFAKSVPNSTLHKTLNVRVFLLKFTERGMKEFSIDDRRAIAKSVRSAVTHEFAGKDGFEKTVQFFPAFSDGALEPEKLAAIVSPIEAAKKFAGKSKIKIGLVRLGDTKKISEALSTALPNSEIFETPKNPDFVKYSREEDMPQLCVIGPDTGFQEDIGLITYSLNAGYFAIPRSERAAWLADYMSIGDKTARLGRLKEAQYKSLSSVAIAPLLSAPYAALARHPWKIKLSQFNANNQLWLIQR